MEDASKTCSTMLFSSQKGKQRFLHVAISDNIIDHY